MNEYDLNEQGADPKEKIHMVHCREAGTKKRQKKLKKKGEASASVGCTVPVLEGDPVCVLAY